MSTIDHERFAACAPDRVWALLADLEAVQRYNPGVRAARFDGALRTGVGARRSCELVPAGRVVERVTHWEEGRALGLELVEHGWPVHSMRWVTRLEADARGTRITQRLEYRVKFGVLGRALDALVLRRRLASSVGAVLDSLVRHAEGRAGAPRAEGSA